MMTPLYKYHTSHGYYHIVIVSRGTKWLKYVSMESFPLTVRKVKLSEEEHMTISEGYDMMDAAEAMLDYGNVIGITKGAEVALTKLLEGSNNAAST